MEPNNEECYLIAGTEFGILEGRYLLLTGLYIGLSQRKLTLMCDVYRLSIRVLINTVNVFCVYIDDLIHTIKDPKVFLYAFNATSKFKNDTNEDTTSDLGPKLKNRGRQRQVC